MYNSIMNFGNIAAWMFCNALLAKITAFCGAGGANSAPWDFIDDINSLQSILYHSIDLFLPICAAIWLNLSVVALPPSPPVVSCIGT